MQGTIIGLFRDLRGIATATNSRRTYCALFDWLYPQHFAVLVKCLEVRGGGRRCAVWGSGACATTQRKWEDAGSKQGEERGGGAGGTRGNALDHVSYKLLTPQCQPQLGDVSTYNHSCSFWSTSWDATQVGAFMLPILPPSPQAWADVPEVTTPMLKFMAEFVFNKSTRLTFDASSPSGILLFR